MATVSWQQTCRDSPVWGPAGLSFDKVGHHPTSNAARAPRHFRAALAVFPPIIQFVTTLQALLATGTAEKSKTTRRKCRGNHILTSRGNHYILITIGV